LLILELVWGAMRLTQDVQIMAAHKIVCDHAVSLRPIADWIEE